ncbi:unnamed protein product [Periconia digitata]|uniref:Uncharacterized protein n=1 Tax=Periconia digitata TaxID=1303443 RepID=A0A9W4U1G7_9PLEO|nr:unnamed protein product [Periconia digitata]
MSSSDADFAASEAQDSSTDHDFDLEIPLPSRALSTPTSPRKRRRSGSGDWIRQRKYHLEGKYSDPYRKLYNDDVNAATSRFVVDDSLNLESSRFGAILWTAKEKNTFFAALERLGQDDLPGISNAIRTKTVAETAQFLLAIQDAPMKRVALRGDARLKVAMQDVPAAMEVGRECEESLELAGDALAWYQERYEAKQEQVKYGEHWLITSELAEEIEQAMQPNRDYDLVSSPGFPDTEHDTAGHAGSNAVSPPIIEDIPEAELLNPAEFLKLSRTFFMNPSPNVSYPWPHWMDLTSEIAQEPSIYRTAFSDIHNLTLSVTRRIIQCAITQATARIRSQGWRVKKGVKPFVKPRDIHTAVDLMGLPRNGNKRWAGAARRCGIQVTDRNRDVRDTGQRRNVPWHEVEEFLGLREPIPTDLDTAESAGGTDHDEFRSKAMRGGTPLPTIRRSLSVQSDVVSDMDSECEIADANMSSRSEDDDSDTSSATLRRSDIFRTKYEEELTAVETFDQDASHKEEQALWGLLDTGHVPHENSTGLKSEADEKDSKLPQTKLVLETGDWRSWTQYRADWEELSVPVPASKFAAAQKSAENGLDDPHDMTGSDDASEGSRSQRNPRTAATHIDIPIRGTREYAEFQERADIPRNQSPGSHYSSDGADIPAPSIETASGIYNSDGDRMSVDDDQY